MKNQTERVNTKNDFDIGLSNKNKIPSYVVTPNGLLQKYTPNDGAIKVISNEMPSDPADPDCLNTNFFYLNISNAYEMRMNEIENILYRK